MKEGEVHPVFQRLGECGVVSVVMIDSPSHAVPLARALLAGGISAMELTLRSDRALKCLRRIAAEVQGMIVGAGTILSEEQVGEVLENHGGAPDGDALVETDTPSRNGTTTGP